MGIVVRTARRLARRVERLAGALEPAGADGPRVPDLGRCERPLLLVPGWLGSRRTFEVLERRLRRDGYGVFTLDLGGLRATALAGIDDLADAVRAGVEALYASHPRLGPLSIVGHSTGGLVAAYYVKKLGGWRRARAVVTLGTPHRGTPIGWLGLPVGGLARSLPQVAPASRFLAQLDRGAWPTQVRLASIWSRSDRAAPWPAGLLETHGLPQLANVEVDAEHQELLTRKRVYEVVLRELRTAEREAPVVKGRLTGMRGGRAAAGPAPEGAADAGGMVS
jgi:pimeloyl-ACP methyl ester carboxylesterase